MWILGWELWIFQLVVQIAIVGWIWLQCSIGRGCSHPPPYEHICQVQQLHQPQAPKTQYHPRLILQGQLLQQGLFLQVMESSLCVMLWVLSNELNNLLLVGKEEPALGYSCCCLGIR